MPRAYMIVESMIWTSACNRRRSTGGQGSPVVRLMQRSRPGTRAPTLSINKRQNLRVSGFLDPRLPSKLNSGRLHPRRVPRTRAAAGTWGRRRRRRTPRTMAAACPWSPRMTFPRPTCAAMCLRSWNRLPSDGAPRVVVVDARLAAAAVNCMRPAKTQSAVAFSLAPSPTGIVPVRVRMRVLTAT